MSQRLPYDGVEMWQGHPHLYMNWLEKILNTPDDSDISYLLKIDLNYPDDAKKPKTFPFCPENKKINPDKNNDFMKKIKTKNYTKSKNSKKNLKNHM